MRNQKYNPSEFEKEIYEFWLSLKIFSPIVKTKKSKNFSILLPPPNVTGNLHIGHAFDVSIQDAIIRFKKLQGYRTIWIPGTDHAGISAQTKFESILRSKNIDLSKMDKKDFLNQLSSWVKTQIVYIHKQWEKLGLGLSYEHEGFTMNNNAVEVVNKAFVELYKKKLIYRAKKLVNWDIKLKTAISDIEVEYRQTKAKMYYFKYFLKDSKEYLTVATTRPETIFVDTNLVVNPYDKKKQKYVGKQVQNPLTGEMIPVIADEACDSNFGTGVLKCTPAHSFEDYEISKRHNITKFNSCIEIDGKLNSFAEQFAGLDRIDARKEIEKFTQNKGVLSKVEEYMNNTGYSQRTGEVVEPMLSMQWFVKMKPIVANLKLLYKKDKKTKYYPPRFEKQINMWLNNIQDWCISRQLVWGHKIPVWYHKKNEQLYVGIKPPKDIENYNQCTDILDTWFSSGLWPLIQTKYNYKKIADFYPIDLLVTGSDILFFWVARMLFQCANLDNSISLNNVLLHGLVRDNEGRKMSKSLGNGIDPIEVVDEHGADTLKMYLISNTNSDGLDVNFNSEKMIHCKFFINKVWNAANYIKNLNIAQTKPKKIANYINIWLINKFSKTVKEITKNLSKYNFIVAYKYLIDFVWETYCNQYLEYTKLLMDSEAKDETLHVARSTYKNILILLHPFAAFATEKIYLDLFGDNKSILLEQWPQSENEVENNELYVEIFSSLFSFSKEIRIKNNLGISTPLFFNLVIENTNVNFNDINKYFKKINVEIKSAKKAIENKNNFIGSFDSFILECVTEIKKDDSKLQNEIKKIELEIARSKEILSNKNFIEKAPKQKVDLEKEKLANYVLQLDKLKNN